jgi:transglutaminase-like putative cysteine protease
MKFKIASRLHYEAATPVTLFLNIRVRPTPLQKLSKEALTIAPETVSKILVTEHDDNRFDRVRVESKEVTLSYDVNVDARHQLVDADQLRKVPTSQLEADVLPYLFPSRYCESDRLYRLAWQKFGKFSSAYDQVLEITRWIHRSVEYVPGATNASTSAYDTVTECAGVCRDFAHLGVALCRALTIPARYVTGYAHRLEPPDFHAAFEAYIGGYWLLFDATRLAPLNGFVQIGRGRDAADVAVCTAFGVMTAPGRYEITCEAPEDFEPFTEEQALKAAISLDPAALPPEQPASK